MPLLPTPYSPEYPSLHTVLAGVAQEVLLAYFGSDNTPFLVGTDSIQYKVRWYPNVAAAVQQLANSRYDNTDQF